MISDKQFDSHKEIIDKSDAIDLMVNNIDYYLIHEVIKIMHQYTIGGNDLKPIPEERKNSVTTLIAIVLAAIKRIYTLKKNTAGNDLHVMGPEDNQRLQKVEGNLLDQTHNLIMNLSLYVKDQMCEKFKWNEFEYYNMMQPNKDGDEYKAKELTKEQNDTILYLINDTAKILLNYKNDKSVELGYIQPDTKNE